jgi:DNA-binding beta-propeller fold protein YncE
MSALGNNTVEISDLRTNKRLHTIAGLHEPQGVTYAPDSNKVFVANADDGKVRVFDGTTYKLVSTLDFGSDADDTRYDAETRHVYVGFGDGGIGVLDSMTGKLLGEIKVRAHPEAFEVEKGDGRIYINVPEAHEIAVADWQHRAIVARWPMEEYHSNFPMALDANDHRLFVVTRRPAQFLALDTASGRTIAHLDAVGDSDDLWYDAARKRIYISGGEGFITVLDQQDADHYRGIARIPTEPGARTSYFSPELGRLYVAVPHRGNQKAELLVYEMAR